MRSLRNGSDWSEGKEIKIEAKIEDSLFFFWQANQQPFACMLTLIRWINVKHLRAFLASILFVLSISLTLKREKYVSSEIRERANV